MSTAEELETTRDLEIIIKPSRSDWVYSNNMDKHKYLVALAVLQCRSFVWLLHQQQLQIVHQHLAAVEQQMFADFTAELKQIFVDDIGDLLQKRKKNEG